jgi:hypothetical protein
MCVIDLEGQAELGEAVGSDASSPGDGNHVRYRIIDPCVTGLLDLGLCFIEVNRAR